MAIFKNNVLFKNLSGKVNDQFVVKTRGEKTILAAMPKSRRTSAKLAEAQEENQNKFRRATSYAKKALANPQLKKAYEAARRGNQSANNVAFRDAYTGPSLRNLRTNRYHGLPGGMMIVEAMDNFRVSKVTFTLLSASGALVEEGEALQAINGYDWVYTARVANPDLRGTIVRVTAEDLPQNQALLEAVL